MTERSYRGVLWGLALLGALLDQGSKYSIFAMLYNNGEGGEHALIPGAFDLLTQYTRQREQGTDLLARLRTMSGEVQPRVNHGALFGFGGEHTLAANYVFAAVSFLAATAILFWSTRRSLARDRLLCVALGLILAARSATFTIVSSSTVSATSCAGTTPSSGRSSTSPTAAWWPAPACS